MQLFIPPLGTKLYLLSPWTFDLYYERRNRGLWDLKFAPPPMDEWPTKWKDTYEQPRRVTLEVGTTLKVDRIYIRKGQDGYSSVTFRGFVLHRGVLHNVRFWVKLEDANKIQAKVT